MLRSTILVFSLVFVGFISSDVFGQEGAFQRTRDLVAALDKTKYKKKEKRGFAIELYIDVRNEPVPLLNAVEYTGTYEANGYRLELTVDSKGLASGSGFESFPDVKRPLAFTLRDARIEGALLTATKTYSSGENLSFEAVFVNRTSRMGTNPEAIAKSETQFGIAWIQNGEITALGECDPTKAAIPSSDNATVGDLASKETGWTNRVFLKKIER